MLKDWNPIIISIRFWLSKRRGLMHCKAKRFLDAVKKFIRQFLDLLLLLFLWAKLLVRVQWKTFAWVFLNIFLLFAIHLGFETGLTLYVRLSPLQDFMTYFFLTLTHCLLYTTHFLWINLSLSQSFWQLRNIIPRVIKLII